MLCDVSGPSLFFVFLGVFARCAGPLLLMSAAPRTPTMSMPEWKGWRSHWFQYANKDCRVGPTLVGKQWVPRHLSGRPPKEPGLRRICFKSIRFYRQGRCRLRHSIVYCFFCWIDVGLPWGSVVAMPVVQIRGPWKGRLLLGNLDVALCDEYLSFASVLSTVCIVSVTGYLRRPRSFGTVGGPKAD